MPTRPGRPRAVRALVLLTAVAGASALSATLHSAWGAGLGNLWLLAVCLGALALLSVFPIVFEWKGETENVNLEEAFFAVLVITSTPAAVAVAMMFAALFLNVYLRLPLLKATFNIGLFATAVSAGLLATHTVAGSLPVGPGWRGLAAVTAGVVTLYGTTTAGVWTVVALSEGMKLRHMFRGTSSTELVILTSSASLGILAGRAFETQPVALLFVLPPLAVITFVLHQHARALRDRRQLDQLLVTAVTANEAADVVQVNAILTEAARVMLHTQAAGIQAEPPVDGEIGAQMFTADSELWLVARLRTDVRSQALKSRGEQQSMLDGIAAIGSSALGSAELLERVKRHAFHDNLTGLANRLLFEDRVSQALRGREHRRVALLFVDLDRFKRVNDSLGHAFGDLLLQQVAERLQMTLRASDSAARLGGDEFAVLLPEADSEDFAVEVAMRISQALREPYVIDGRELVVTASVGVAVAPGDGLDCDTLLRAADLAMYEAKTGGRDTVRRSTITAIASSDGDLALETDLRHALLRDELWVAYQPQVDLSTRRIVGTEALVRWRHPERGEMRPDEFLPLAEQLGLLTAIDEWVLETACRQTADWRAAGAKNLRVAVNLSAGPLRSTTLEDTIVRTLERSGLPASALEIEVTEQVAATEGEAAIASLNRLRALGVRVAIDDFGTGYSSLSRLRSLPADVVKVDRSFVREIVDAHSSVPLVTSTITMAHGLGLEIVAEGIETPAQLAFLTAHGCETGQGYLLGRPVPPAAVHMPGNAAVPAQRRPTASART